MADDYAGFILNVEKLFGSMAFQRMAFSAKGVYLVMLCQQWREPGRNLPDDPKAVADLIALTTAQVDEVLAAWDEVRRKFVVSKHATGRIYNAELERTRRKQRANRRKVSDASRVAGKASAAKRRSDKDLTVNGRSTAVQRPSTIKGVEIKGVEIKGEKDETPRRASRPPTVFDGMLPKDHAHHVFCSESFSVCVPAQVHAKYLGRLIVARFHGDRQAAHDGLLAWYATVAAALPPETVMGDAFKFWDAHFDGHWATPPPAKGAADEVMWLDLGKKGPTKRPYEVAK